MVKINQSLSKEKRILKAAETVFSKNGYSQATLDEVIKIADTGKGTVYKYYQNKENLFYTLISEKSRRFSASLEKAYKDNASFKDQMTQYAYTCIKFFTKQEVLWSVLLFEVLNEQGGWRLLWDDTLQDYKVEIRWGKGPSEQEVAVKKRYAELLRAEIMPLRQILHDAIAAGFIKPIANLPMMTENFFFSLVMLVFQHTVNPENMEKSVDEMLNRFLYGHWLGSTAPEETGTGKTSK